MGNVDTPEGRNRGLPDVHTDISVVVSTGLDRLRHGTGLISTPVRGEPSDQVLLEVTAAEAQVFVTEAKSRQAGFGFVVDPVPGHFEQVAEVNDSEQLQVVGFGRFSHSARSLSRTGRLHVQILRVRLYHPETFEEAESPDGC